MIEYGLRPVSIVFDPNNQNNWVKNSCS